MKKAFSMGWLSRNRWNVLDSILVVGKGAVATYLFSDIDMTFAETLRAKLRALGHKTTVTAILLKAIAIAQHRYPEARSVLLPWGRTCTLNNIVAGFTVEKFVDGEPVVFFGAISDPDTKPLEQIASELKSYATDDVTQVPQLNLEHRFTKVPWLIRRLILWVGLRFPAVRLLCLGATFGVSSLGKLGMKAIIPPCVTTSTFGVGEVEDRAVVRDGKIEIRPMLTVTLNFDHRLIDGAPAARFLQDVRSLMEGGLWEYVQGEIAGYEQKKNGQAGEQSPSISPSAAVAL